MTLADHPEPDKVWKYEDPYVPGYYDFQVVDGDVLYIGKYTIEDAEAPVVRLQALTQLEAPPSGPE